MAAPRKIGLSSLALVAGALCSCSVHLERPDAGAEVPKLLSCAELNLEAGRLESARETIERVLQQSPDNPRGIELGVLLEYEQGGTERGLKKCNSALTRFPHSGRLRAYRAMLEFLAGEGPDRLAELESVGGSSECRTLALLVAGLLRLAREDYRGAIGDAEICLRAGPSPSATWLVWACSTLLGEIEKAETCWATGRLADHSPVSSQCLCNDSLASFAPGAEGSLGRSTLLQAQTLMPVPVNLLLMAADRFLRGNLPDARSALDALVPGSRGSSLAYYYSGRVSDAAGSPKAAVREFSAALEHNERFYEAAYARGCARLRIPGEDGLAREDFRRALSIAPAGWSRAGQLRDWLGDK